MGQYSLSWWLYEFCKGTAFMFAVITMLPCMLPVEGNNVHFELAYT